MNNVDEKIRDAGDQFKTAIEKMGKTNVVIIYSYIGPDNSGKDVLFTRIAANSFVDVLGTCEVVKHDVLNGKW